MIPSGTVLMMAGGTGGHVVPALAVAAELRRRGYNVEWLGSERGIESRLVPQQGITLHRFPVAGLRGKDIIALVRALAALVTSVFMAIRLLRKIKPVAVVGMGGFASGPGALAAKLLRIPIVIHEQNAVAGTTNRVLARLARRVLCAFDNTLDGTVIGNPVPATVAAISAHSTRSVGSQTHMLVMGGSLGALALNQMVPLALSQLSPECRPTVVHQCGRGRVEETERAFRHLGVEAQVVEFIDDVAAQYQWADFIVCRSGALTVSEIACAGLPSILVPFPYAIDDHQTANAQVLVDAGAGVLCQQSDWTESIVASLIDDLTNKPDLRAAMMNASQMIAVRDAAIRATEIIESLIHE